MFAGLCYSEFAAMVPVCGSAYAYSYATLGEIVAWFVGWNLVLEYMMACSTVAVGWSRYFVAFLDVFHVHLPDALTSAPFAAGETGFEIHRTGAIINLPGDADRRCGRGPLLQGHQGIGHRQHHHRRHQGQHRGRGDRLRRVLRQHRPTGSPTSRRTPAPSASSAGAASGRPRRSSSSPTSASTASPRSRRKPRTRRAACRSACSAASASARCCTS